MTDSVYNTLVTILLIFAAVIVFSLLSRYFTAGTGAISMQQQQYSYQPASAIEVFRDRPVTKSSSTTYTYIPSTSYQNSYSQSSTTYSYSCDGMGHCWTNQ